MKSIRSRLTTGLLISLITVFVILWITVSSNIQKLSENYIASRLKHDMETLVIATGFDKQNKLIINASYIDTIYNRPFSGHYYSIQYNETTIRSRSLWDQTLEIQKASSGDYQKTYQQGPENQSLIVMTRLFSKNNQDIIISIGEDITPIQEEINKFKNYFTILSSVILFGLLLVQIIILRNGLRPLGKVRRELHELENGRITELTTDVPYELKPVVNEVNNLSLALYKRLERSRNALSDLSHAIKNPLTLLQQFSDKHKTSLNEESIKTLNNQIENIQQITDRILKRARVSGGSRLNKAFNPNEDLPVLIKTITAMYPDKHIRANLNIPYNLEINIDREDMLELLGNLLDNAWKWANSTINITLRENKALSIIVEDDGSGSNAESLNELATRGVRLDESVKGYGFGLAIASDIVRDYNGTLMFFRSDTLGGFKAVIEIPVNTDLGEH